MRASPSPRSDVGRSAVPPSLERMRACGAATGTMAAVVLDLDGVIVKTNFVKHAAMLSPSRS